MDHPGVLGGWKRSIKNRVRVRGARGREMPRVGDHEDPCHDCSGE